MTKSNLYGVSCPVCDAGVEEWCRSVPKEPDEEPWVGEAFHFARWEAANPQTREPWPEDRTPQEERADVVAWLRDHASWGAAPDVLLDAANVIEKGEHTGMVNELIHYGGLKEGETRHPPEWELRYDWWEGGYVDAGEEQT